MSACFITFQPDERRSTCIRRRATTSRHVPRYRYRDELAALTAPSSIAAARESGAAQHFRLVAVSGINRNRAAPLGEQGSPARSVKPSGERERAARSGFRDGVVSSHPTPDDSRLITQETTPP